MSDIRKRLFKARQKRRMCSWVPPGMCSVITQRRSASGYHYRWIKRDSLQKICKNDTTWPNDLDNYPCCLHVWWIWSIGGDISRNQLVRSSAQKVTHPKYLSSGSPQPSTRLLHLPVPLEQAGEVQYHPYRLTSGVCFFNHNETSADYSLTGFDIYASGSRGSVQISTVLICLHI